MKSSQETCYIGIGIFGREKNGYFVLFLLPFLVAMHLEEAASGRFCRWKNIFILIVHDSDRSCSV